MSSPGRDDAPWVQLILEPGPFGTDALEDALLAAGAIAVTLSDGGQEAVLEPAPGEKSVRQAAPDYSLQGPGRMTSRSKPRCFVLAGHPGGEGCRSNGYG